ncbi:MAG: hypothetical protein ACI4M3_03480, partial [Acutalibacteraceae bacterium]
MIKNKKRCLCLVLSLVLAACGLSACSPKTAEESSQNSSAPESSVQSENSEESSPESQMEESSQGENFYDTSVPALDDPTPDAEGTFYEGIYVYNNSAFEMFYGGESAAKNYADTISNLKNAFGDNVTVYNI